MANRRIMARNNNGQRRADSLIQSAHSFIRHFLTLEAHFEASTTTTLITMFESKPMTKVLIFGGKTGWIGQMMYQHCKDQGT
jgi:hypothetical protein